MSGKNQFPPVFNWQSANPITSFLPLPANQTGSIPSGVLAGTMASTNTIYSNILDLSKMDNVGIEVTWTGSPNGTLLVMGSNSGKYFYSLTFSPPLTQPSGSASGYLLNLNQYPFKYILFQYTNSSGTGSLFVYGQAKDLN